jgi:hypothetical protein
MKKYFDGKFSDSRAKLRINAKPERGYNLRWILDRKVKLHQNVSIHLLP